MNPKNSQQQVLKTPERGIDMKEAVRNSVEKMEEKRLEMQTLLAELEEKSWRGVQSIADAVSPPPNLYEKSKATLSSVRLPRLELPQIPVTPSIKFSMPALQSRSAVIPQEGGCDAKEMADDEDQAITSLEMDVIAEMMREMAAEALENERKRRQREEEYRQNQALLQTARRCREEAEEQQKQREREAEEERRRALEEAREKEAEECRSDDDDALRLPACCCVLFARCYNTHVCNPLAGGLRESKRRSGYELQKKSGKERTRK